MDIPSLDTMPMILRLGQTRSRSPSEGRKSYMKLPARCSLCRMDLSVAGEAVFQAVFRGRHDASSAWQTQAFVWIALAGAAREWAWRTHRVSGNSQLVRFAKGADAIHSDCVPAFLHSCTSN